ncbi:MAG: hypothetical protein H6682_16860 [Candidatus Eisenbacteria bacterium]|nr:hypothetical protein [Candidatus Eisenbacteria bacterium]
MTRPAIRAVGVYFLRATTNRGSVESKIVVVEPNAPGPRPDEVRVSPRE